MNSRTALVTGASRGIGKACVEVLASAGHRVVLAARSVDKLEETASALRAAGTDVFVIEIDLSKPESIVNGISKTAKEFGHIDILVSNAGITKDGLAVRMKQADCEIVLQTNLSGSFYAIQQVLPGMMRERWGRIVNISSVVGERGNPGQANYVASKAGLIGMTKSVAQELASRGITANAVAPGFMTSAMTDALNDQQREAILSRIPIGQMGSGDDIGAACVYLASKEAGYVTGQTLHVNGGMAML